MTLPENMNIPLTELGSRLFLRGVSGTRVIRTSDDKMIAGTRFIGKFSPEVIPKLVEL